MTLTPTIDALDSAKISFCSSMLMLSIEWRSSKVFLKFSPCASKSYFLWFPFPWMNLCTATLISSKQEITAIQKQHFATSVNVEGLILSFHIITEWVHFSPWYLPIICSAYTTVSLWKTVFCMKSTVRNSPSGSNLINTREKSTAVLFIPDHSCNTRIANLQINQIIHRRIFLELIPAWLEELHIRAKLETREHITNTGSMQCLTKIDWCKAQILCDHPHKISSVQLGKMLGLNSKW